MEKENIENNLSYPGEGVDYEKVEEGSIWGEGDKETWEKLHQLNISGDWLNLAAGDGRYNRFLLEHADSVTAIDIDENALLKLEKETPKELRRKLKVAKQDITKDFQFPEESFDGIFCTGTLHLLPKDKLTSTLGEMKGSLKKGGIIFIDFATDVKRTKADGKLIIFGDEPQYTLEEAKKLLLNEFKNFEIDIEEAECLDEFVESSPPYKFECNYLILKAEN